MIHLLEINLALSAKEVSKLARRYAMTGGYEIALAQELSDDELSRIASLWKDELKGMNVPVNEMRTSNAYRILSLIRDDIRTPQVTRQELSQILV